MGRAEHFTRRNPAKAAAFEISVIMLKSELPHEAPNAVSKKAARVRRRGCMATRAQQATVGFFRRNARERGVHAGDEGPALSNYAAAFLDETGELNLLEPCLPDELGASRGTTSLK